MIFKNCDSSRLTAKKWLSGVEEHLLDRGEETLLRQAARSKCLFRATVRIFFLILAVIIPVWPAQGSIQEDMAFESSAFMADTAYRKPESLALDIAADGAESPVNMEWDSIHQGKWYIEEQRYGADAIVAGVVKNNAVAMDRGIKILQWGFSQQQPDGSFSCPDTFHSASFFIEAAAHACLILEASSYARRYRSVIDSMKPRLLQEARWMCRPDVEKAGRLDDTPYTHRRYLDGCALGETGVLCGDQSLIEKSWSYVQDGIKIQAPDGHNPEKGGYDCSYHAVGLTFAGRYYAIVANPEQRHQLLPMLQKGVAWLATRVLPDGTLNPAGNTRTGLGQETGRNGTLKGLNYGSAYRVFYRWSMISGDGAYAKLAKRVFDGEQKAKRQSQ